MEEVLAVYTHELGTLDIHFRFEGGILRIQELLQLIITSMGMLVWPIDKEEPRCRLA